MLGLYFSSDDGKTLTLVSAANPLPVTGGGGTTNGALETTQQSVLAALQDTSAVATYPAGREYEACPASATTTLGATGAVGDDLDHIIIVPGTTSPGAVSIKDGGDTAIVVFAGGASSVATLHSWTLAIGMKSRTGAWQIVTGTNVTVLPAGNFT